jgi:hypothetical protein
MRALRTVLGFGAVALATLATPAPSLAQDTDRKEDAKVVPPLFERETPLTVTLTANLGRLRADKDTNAPWRTGTLAYSAEGRRVAVPMRVRTRGLWRLKNCHFPPLRLDFAGKEAKNTLLAQLGKPKLVNYCRDNDSYEQYILQEHQLYRIYQLLTPISYRVRLLRVAYVDSASGDTNATRYAILAEDPDHLARRLGGLVLKSKGAKPSDLEAPQLALAYLFQYMIGNTDFSFNGLHNTQIVATSDGLFLPVAYDFDYAGAVNASYATPDPVLRTRNVRQRKFRGYCSIADEYPRLLPLFHEKKNAIYALYRDEIGKLMDEQRVRETLSYFDEFYEMIRTPESAQRSFLNECVGPR